MRSSRLPSLEKLSVGGRAFTVADQDGRAWAAVLTATLPKLRRLALQSNQVPRGGPFTPVPVCMQDTGRTSSFRECGVFRLRRAGGVSRRCPGGHARRAAGRVRGGRFAA